MRFWQNLFTPKMTRTLNQVDLDLKTMREKLLDSIQRSDDQKQLLDILDALLDERLKIMDDTI